MKRNASRAFGPSSSRDASPPVPTPFFKQLARLLLSALFLAANGIVVYAQDPAEPAGPELHVVGVYEGENSVGQEPGLVHVNVNRAGKTVVLFLSAYDPVIWQLNVAPGTTVQKVYASGYYRQRVQGLPPGAELQTQSYEESTGYLLVGYSIDSSEFLASVPKVKKATGLEMSSFQGAYHPITPFVIDRIQDDPRLRSDYPQPVPPEEVPDLEFEVAFRGAPLTIQRYTLQGPLNAGDSLLPAMRVVPDLAKRFYYGAESHTIVKIDAVTGTEQEIPYETVTPGGWPMGAAYDTKRDRAVIVSLVSQGFLYHNNGPTQNEWTLLAELDGRDYHSLEYHAANDSFYAFADSYARPNNRIHRLSPTTGEVLGEIIFPLLPYALAHHYYDAKLISVGEYLVALIGPKSWMPMNEPADSRIYLIDPRNGEVKLTYRKVQKPANQRPIVAITSPTDGTEIELGLTVELRAEAFDPDGEVVSVEFLANGQKIADGVHKEGKIYEASWQPGVARDYAISAVVKDNEGAIGGYAAVRIVVKGNGPPLVHLVAPPSGSRFTPGETVQLVAHAFDTDGAVTKVEFFANGEFIGRGEPLVTAQGGDAIAIIDPRGSAFGLRWKPPVPGSYTLTAKATDNRGAVGTSDPVHITVGEREPLSVQIIAPQSGDTFAPGTAVRLLAHAYGPNGVVASVEFFANGRSLGFGTPAPVPLASAALDRPDFLGAVYQLEWRPSVPGIYALTAVAKDIHGATATSSEVRILVTGGRPPIVQIVAPRPGAKFPPAAVVRLVAHAFDFDGSIASVEFFANGKSIGRGKELELPFLPTDPIILPPTPGGLYELNWTPEEAGPYLLTAKATNNDGLSGTSGAVQIVVEGNGRPVVQIVAPQSGASFAPGTKIRLLARAHDPDGTVVSLDFYADGALIGHAQEVPDPAAANRPVALGKLFALDWTPVSPANYVLTAKATDNAGAFGTSSPVRIVVEGNRPPTVRIVSPEDGASFAPGTEVSLLAHAIDPEHSIVSVEFFANGISIGEGREVPTLFPAADFAPIPGGLYALEWKPASAGTYLLTAKVTDRGGLSAISAPVRVVVRENRPPTVRLVSPPAGSVLRAGEAAQVVAEAFDADGIQSVEFFANDRSVGFAQNLGGILFRRGWTPLSAGPYRLHAKATDRTGATTLSGAVEVTVVDAPIVVLRNMPRFYRPGAKFRVRLIVDPGSSVLTYSVTDTPPAGWIVNRVTHGGTYDAATGTVKFGPFEDGRRRVLAYQLTVPETATGAQSFAGTVVADDVTQPIGGMQTTTLLPKLSGERPAGVAASTPDR